MKMLWNLYCYWFGFRVFRWLPSLKNMIETVNIIVFFLLKTTSSFLFSLVTWQWLIKAWCFRKNISADFLLVSYLSTLLPLLVYIIKSLLQIRNINGTNAQERSGEICWSWTSTCFHCPSWVPPYSTLSNIETAIIHLFIKYVSVKCNDTQNQPSHLFLSKLVPKCIDSQF